MAVWSTCVGLFRETKSFMTASRMLLAAATPDGTGVNLVVASAAAGRIIRRLGEAAKGRSGLAASPDGKTLYYSESGSIWAIPAADGPARKLTAGDRVAPDPNGVDLIVTRQDEKAA